MAERRMFSKSIVTSDAFLDMPSTARCLYFTLAMFADDDGFVNNPKSIMRQVGSTTDDINILLAKKFVISFESGIIVIKHWRIHNYIRGDRKRATKYLDELGSLSIDDNGAYTVRSLDDYCKTTDGQLTDICQATDGQLTDICHTEDRIGKDRGKDRIGKDRAMSADMVEQVMSAWNELPVNHITKIGRNTQRYKMLNARIGEYGIDAVLEAINLISQSPFLLGRVTDFVITFDWFIKPNNFIKVYEGNYANRGTETKNEGRLDWIDDL